MKELLLLDVKPQRETKVERLNRKRAAKDENTPKDMEKAIKMAGIPACYAAHFAAAWEPIYIGVSWVRVKKETKFGTTTTSTFLGPNLSRMADFLKKHGTHEGCRMDFIDQKLQWEIENLPEDLKEGRDKINMVLLRNRDTLEKLLNQEEADNLEKTVLWSGGKQECPMVYSRDHVYGYWGLSMVGWKYLQHCLVKRLKQIIVVEVKQAIGQEITIKNLWLGNRQQGEWEGRLIAKNHLGNQVVTKEMDIAEFDGSYAYNLGVKLGVIEEPTRSPNVAGRLNTVSNEEFLAKFKAWNGSGADELLDYSP